MGEFSSLYEQFQNNIYSISLLKKSNHDEFFSKLKDIIYNSKEIAENNYKEYLIHTIRHFDEFFSIDIKSKKKKNEEESIALRDEFFQKFDELVKDTNNQIDGIFEEMKNKLITYLKTEKGNLKKILEKNGKDVEKALEYISKQLNEKAQTESEKIEQVLQESNKKMDDIRREYEEKLKLLEKDTEMDEKVKTISMKLKAYTDYKKIISCFSLGIGVGGAAALAYILGVAAVPGVGWGSASILSDDGIIGLIFSDSKEKKLEKSINTIISKIEKNISSKKRSFFLILKKIMTN